MQGVGTVAAWGTNLCAQCFVLVAGSACSNPFNAREPDANMDDSEEDSDNDNHDGDN